MRESTADLSELQQLLDRSYTTAGEHVRAIFDEKHLLSAEELVDALVGIFEMHMATVAGDGSPLVAPLDGILFKGKIWFGFPPRSVRARLVRRDSRVSASYTSPPSLAFIVHGKANELDETGPDFAEYDGLRQELYVGTYGPGWIDWYERQRRHRDAGAAFDGWIEPRLMFAKR